MKQLILILLFLCAVNGLTRAQKTFATVELSRKAVYPGEPFQLTVTTYTSTYYLSPITFQDFRVPNAFTISFSRTLSAIKRIDGQQYATLQFFIQVYPLESGMLEIPSLNLSFQSPPEGDYKGKAQQIETQATRITIKPIPDKSIVKPWFVSNNVTLSDQWSRSPQTYKVGDVIERQVLVKAYGTLPQFIPELNFESAEHLEIYPKTAELLDKRNDEQAIGWKTQRVLYLLTKAGDVVIPALEINWFNPLSSKANQTKIEAKTIEVLPNENLGILESIRDSLNVHDTSNTTIAPPDKTNYRQITLLASLLLIALFLGWKGIKYLLRLQAKIQEKQRNYRKSADWQYAQIFKSTHSATQVLNAINTWWDLERNGNQPASISEALQESPQLDTWLEIQEMKAKPSKKDLKTLMMELRRLVKRKDTQVNAFSINP